MKFQSDLYARWSLEVRRSDFFCAGERVGVAVSGGADSILLLTFMKQLARELGLTVAAVHFNHHLRGAESDADEKFVRERAGQLGIEYLNGAADVGQVARARRRNLEATARDLRYGFFFSLVSQGRLDKVATAHTANDQAETVLLRLLRGTGTRGLGGIYPVLDGKIVRPFLNVIRAEIERELKERKLEARLDSTNLDTRLRRNRVRLELLPWLQNEFNPRIIGLLVTFADRARDDDEFMEEQARERSRPWRVREGHEERIPVSPFTKLPPAIARRVLRQMILSITGHLRGITYRHVESLRQFVGAAQSGRRLELPAGLEARKDFDWVTLAPQPSGKDEWDFCYPVKIPAEISVPELGLNFQFKIIGSGDRSEAYNVLGTVGLDAQELSGPLVLRNWRAGDRFRMSGSHKARNLKELFARRKIPLSQRKMWPVLACGEEIVWMRDFPVANGLALASNSKRVLVTMNKIEPDCESA